MNRKITLSYIAEQLGLSTATISLALRDSPLVADTTREKIKKAASDMGYIYDRRAASLRTARSDIVGILIHTVLNPFFAELLESIESELSRTGRTFLLCNHDDSLEKQRGFVSTLLQFGADGVLLCPSIGTDAAEIERIEDFGLPVTLVARTVDDAPTNCVRGDDCLGAKIAAEHLFSLGHKSIAVIGGRSETSTGRERLRGILQAHQEAGLTFDETMRIETESTSRIDAFEACERLLDSGAKPDAIFAFNDVVAFGILACLQQRGLQIGKDIAVIGYDDVDEATISAPPLTSIDNGQHDVGVLAAKQLISRIEGEERQASETLIMPKLVVRESCGAKIKS